ncbi:MAG: hypothetical protein ACPGU1_15170 [Myxococcota bacterium]
MRRLLLITGALVASVTALACEEDAQLAASSFGSPVDFSYACAGANATVKPVGYSEATSEALCASDDGASANLFGLVLTRNPARLHAVQMNTASADMSGVIDADGFIPGFTGIPIDDAPLRLLRSEDWSSFFVLSSGGPSLQRIVIHGIDDAGRLSYTADAALPLPERPSDAFVDGDTIWVASATSPTVWSYAIGADGALSASGSKATPARVHTMESVGDHVLVTWTNYPRVSLVDDTFTTISEVTLVSACQDGLDNDEDGFADAADPDCQSSEDTTEGGTVGGRPEGIDPLNAPTAYYPPEVAPCHDGIDNDGDGFTDSQDTACADSIFGEWLPACADGIDNDGDGSIDTADTTCYGAHDTTESLATTHGPYHATFVNGRGHDGTWYGQFVYVLDSQRERILVFELGADGHTLTPVDVPGLATEVPKLDYVDYLDGTDGSLSAIPRSALLGPARAGELGLPIGALGGINLSSGQLRGELWSRLLPDRSVTPGTIDWTPIGCSPDDEGEVCTQPTLDDATWYVFMPTLSGDILLIEAIRRGTPVHRFAQLTTLPENRIVTIGTPTFVHRGVSSTLTSARSSGAPMLGPDVEEELASAVEGVSAPLSRFYGVWPAGYPEDVDNEAVATETWSLTYEGAIPKTAATLGRMRDGQTFEDSGADFCSAGVIAGDWLTLEVVPSNVSEALRTAVVLEDASGQLCPLEAVTTLFIDVPVTTVGQTTLGVDLQGARSRPALPSLDKDAIEKDPALSLSDCQAARQALDLNAQVVQLNAGDAPITITPADLPRVTQYVVRVAQSWAVVGTRSGFLHDQHWQIDAETGEGRCEVTPQSTPTYTARLTQRSDTNTYVACPPPLEQLKHDASSPLYTEVADGRFTNVSFSLDIFEGCEETPEGIIARPSQRDMQWIFEVNGPDAPKVTAAQRINSYAGTVLHTPRIPVMPLMRQQVQLDSGGRRVHVLQVRANALDHIATFE